MRTILMLLGLLTVPTFAGGQGTIEPDESFVIHGTINIAFGNQNGMVVLTDSMLTSGNHQLTDPGEKLFKLDDRTVCAVAGFIAAPGPAPDLNASTSAIIHEYIKQSLNQPRQSIIEKLKTLASLLNWQLSAIAGERTALGKITPTDLYGLDLIIAGFDIDGKPKIGQLRLRMRATLVGLQSTVKDGELETIGNDLVFRLGGMPDIAARILSTPAHLRKDAAIMRYARSLKEHKGSDLSTNDMVAIAKRLAYYTARAHPEVGGPNQIAVLANDTASIIDQPQLRPPPDVILKFSLLIDSSFTNSGIAFGQKPTLVCIRCHWRGMTLELDGSYFFESTFENSTLMYNGGRLTFDVTNKVKHSKLYIGSKAKLDTPQMQSLERHFPKANGIMWNSAQ